MIRVSRENAVAICQDNGFLMADGWDVPKLQKKLERVVKVASLGDYVPKNRKLRPILAELVGAEEFKVVGIDEAADDPETKEDAINNPLKVGQRLFVRSRADPDEKPYKAKVKELLNDTQVLVYDRKGDEWVANVEDCEIVRDELKVVPEKLEKGMWFMAVGKEGKVIFEMNYIPWDVEDYIQLNGYPVQPYIVFQGNPNLPDETQNNRYPCLRQDTGPHWGEFLLPKNASRPGSVQIIHPWLRAL